MDPKLNSPSIFRENWQLSIPSTPVTYYHWRELRLARPVRVLGSQVVGQIALHVEAKAVSAGVTAQGG